MQREGLLLSSRRCSKRFQQEWHRGDLAAVIHRLPGRPDKSFFPDHKLYRSASMIGFRHHFHDLSLTRAFEGFKYPYRCPAIGRDMFYMSMYDVG
jgi:hypothetical protein